MQDVPELSVDDPMLHEAYREAVLGYRTGGIPIGAVLVHNGEVIGRGHNLRVQSGDPILHGEMACIQNAGRRSPAVYRECTLYTTQSPCAMCAGTVLLFGIPRVVIGESISARQVTNFLDSGRTIDQFLRHVGVETTVYDDPACYELLERFMHEQPEAWAEDIGDIGEYADPNFVRLT